MSLTDSVPFTMPVTPAGNSNGGYGWGDGGFFWIVVLFLLAMFGWGGNGWGGNAGGVADNYVLATDFATIERKLDGVNNGICDGFYTMNTGMLNGFAGVTQAINGGFSAAEVARCNAQMAFMQQFYALQQQLADCCCQNREAIAQVRYDMATQACDVKNTINNATRDIIDNNNANSRALMDYLVTSKMQDLQTENQNLKRAASDEALKAYVSGQFAYYNPRPVPAFGVAAPYQYSGCCGAA